MAFPADPLDAAVELYVDGAWVDVTSDALSRDQVVISRGRLSEGSRAVPTSCAVSIRNTTGTYSPRNPASPYYGLIGRNTPLRIYTGTPHLGAGGGSGTASTSHIAPSVTATDAGLLVCGWMSDDALDYTLPGSMTAGPAETDGSYSTMRTAYETVAAGATGTRTATASASQGYVSVSAVAHGASVAVQESLSGVSSTIDDVTLTTDTATEAGWWLVAVQGWLRGFDVPMPDAPYGDDGGWILLGDSDAVTGTFGASTTVYLRTRVWARRVNTDGAQAVIFPGIAEADTSAADNHAALYVLSGVTGWSIRATTEVPAWPARWDVTGTDVWVPITGQGILRRLQQGASPLKSAMRRAISGAGATVRIGVSLLPAAYWPLEDATGSTQAASGLPSGAPLAASGAITWASVSSDGSSPLPDWDASTGSLSGPVSGVTSGADWGVGCLVQYEGTGSWTALSTSAAGGVYSELQLVLSGSITVNGVTSSGTTALLTDATDLSDGSPHWVEIRASNSGGTAFWDLYVDGVLLDTASAAGAVGDPTGVSVQARGTGTATLGHVGVWESLNNTLYTALISKAITGHAGEVAGRRIERLCHEEGIAVHIVGDPDDTQPMGAQSTATLLDLVGWCEDADGGILYEPREALGLAYRCASSLYNQPVTLALTYGGDGEVAPPLEPVDDDQRTRNDVTVTRSGGSSAQYEVTSGPLSTAAPPDGVGRYDTSVQLYVATDTQLPDQASWRAHLGTWDEPRYPTIRVDLAALGNAAKTTLLDAAAAMDIGDRATIDDVPVWLPPGPVDQHAEGYTETLAQFVWDLTMVCTPAGPWQVATVDGEARVAADGSTLASAVTSSQTTLAIASTDANGPWTQELLFVPMDVRVGAEQVTVGVIYPAAADLFDRYATSEWGTATTGQAWTTTGGSASDYSVAGG